MVAFAEASGNAFQPGEDEQIIGYLSATQTPDAVNQRKAQVAAASSAGRSMVSAKARAAPDQSGPPSRFSVRTTGFVAFVLVSMLVLCPAAPLESPSRRGGASSCWGSPRRNLIAARSANPEAGERHTANVERKNLALRCYRRPAPQRAARPVSNLLFSLRRKESHSVVLDMFIGGNVGLRGDHA